MKFYLSLLAVLAIIFSGCSGTGGSYSETPPPYTPPGTTANVTEDPIPTDTPPPETTVVDPSLSPPPPPPPPPESGQPKPWSPGGTAAQPAPRQFPKGTAVPGKPGRVISPYAPYAGEVDVTGFSAGTEVKCPYTGKIFVVP
ncbi:MAG: hypothetical protein SNJ84_06515 [Verrucomicrobiia bacterium]